MNELNIECPLCKQDDITPIHSKVRNIPDASSKMYKCEHCQTHFLYPQPQEEQLEVYYDGQFREEVHSAAYYDKAKLDTVFQAFSPEASTRVSRIEQELQPTDELLEIGCSVGYFLSAVVNKVQTAYGTEWDSRARAYINEVLADPRIRAKKNPQDYQMQFDKIFLFHVLEHIADPILFLNGLKPLLKKTGKIYIEVPNVDDIMVKTFRCDAYMDYYYKKAHLYNFNETGLNYIFEHCDLSYDIRHIQRYDISNHFYWLANKNPGGKGYYKNILSDQVNEAYVKSLIDAKQSDTLFAVISLPI